MNRRSKKWIALWTCGAVLGFAPPVFASCDFYAGHFDLEGKIGNSRNIGEASAFLPVACTQNRLLFTDLKFRADNLSNREVNIGIGGRIQREDGIAGGYIYFDRKKSGETDKFYTQVTTGAEWLADHWETRANVYIPLNGSKTVGSGVIVSDPYLAGTGIFIDRGGFQIKETPMYGADAELGFKTIENLWLYGGGFTFHGNDVSTITGARVRAKYDLTEKVSLNAEGQYDDERGRQGWLGARLSVPFGNASATHSRMTQSPVRDVDIVTQAKVVVSEVKTTTALPNPESGDAQRVIYVDNRAAANGDGSLEKPYNTFVDAQGDLRDYDIVYVFHGDGTTKGQDQGFVIDKDNVSFIGEGSPLTFAGYTLRAAGKKPVLTNISTANAAGHALFVTGRSPTISGLQLEDAEQSGLFVDVLDGFAGDVNLHNLNVARNGQYGVMVRARDQSGKARIIADRLEVTSSERQGIVISAIAGGHVREILFSRIDISDSKSQQGLFISAGGSDGPGIIDNIELNEVSTSNITGHAGFRLRVLGAGSEINRMRVNDFHSENNSNSGILFLIQSGGYLGNAAFNNVHLQGNRNAFDISINASSVIEDMTIDGMSAVNNVNGFYVQRLNVASDLKNVVIKNSDFVDNLRSGIYLNDDGGIGGAINVSFTGSNRITGNSLQSPGTYGDVMLDLNGGSIDMRDNWWGQVGGPVAGQIISEGPPPDDGYADTSTWLDEDPRP